MGSGGRAGPVVVRVGSGTSDAARHRMATIIIDPGHGGRVDAKGSAANRSVGPRGTEERLLTLDIGRRLADRVAARGHRVALTRDGDTNPSARERATVARKARADAFVSIHFNGSPDRTVQGTEVLVGGPDGGGVDPRSRRLADGIRGQLSASLGLPDRGVHEGRWLVLDQALHDPGTARCIVEVSYLTDPREEARLSDAQYRARIADALTRGVEDGLRPGRAVRSRGLQQALDWCQIRFGIIKSADEEQGFWLDSASRLKTESDPTVLEMLEKYWRDGARVTNWAHAAQRSAADDVDFPWSAAFVSWVVTNAGVPDGVGFDFSMRHMTYIVGALRNREGNHTDRPFWLYKPDEAIVAPGDIVCRNRKVKGVMTTHSYESLKRAFWDKGRDTVPPTGSSHSDVAIGYQDDDSGKRFMEVVGGNADDTTQTPHVSDTVGSKLIEVDAQGYLVSPGPVFALIKLIECEAAPASTGQGRVSRAQGERARLNGGGSSGSLRSPRPPRALAGPEARWGAGSYWPAKYPIIGMDVSHYQGKVDWNQVHGWRNPDGNQMRFCFIKATEGAVDDRFDRNWALCCGSQRHETEAVLAHIVKSLADAGTTVTKDDVRADLALVSNDGSYPYIDSGMGAISEAAAHILAHVQHQHGSFADLIAAVVANHGGADALGAEMVKALDAGGTIEPGILKEITDQAVAAAAAGVRAKLRARYDKLLKKYKDPDVSCYFTPATGDAGLVRGAYHFFHPRRSGSAQAQQLFDAMEGAGGLRDEDLPPVIDFESNDSLTSKTSVADALEECLVELERLSGRVPIIYTAPGLWDGFIARADDGRFARYPLWVARYDRGDKDPTSLDPARSPSHHVGFKDVWADPPSLPAYTTDWGFWQVRIVPGGEVDGVAGTLDCNVFSGDLAALQAMTNRAATTGVGFAQAERGMRRVAGRFGAGSHERYPRGGSDPRRAPSPRRER
jgi:N-acetylmuramoyl-L-alanine amidase/GH25 family lysozyme M1 (1,4-beta-N-acetylmuramidase)